MRVMPVSKLIDCYAEFKPRKRLLIESTTVWVQVQPLKSQAVAVAEGEIVGQTKEERERKRREVLTHYYWICDAQSVSEWI